MNRLTTREANIFFLALFVMNGVNAATKTDSNPPVEWYFAGVGHSNSLYLTDECDLLDRITEKRWPSQIVFVDDNVDLTSNQVVGVIVMSANSRFKSLCDLSAVGKSSTMVVWISNSVGRRSKLQFRSSHKKDWVLCDTSLNSPETVCDKKYRNGFVIAKKQNEEKRKKNEARLARIRAAEARRARELEIKQRMEAARAQRLAAFNSKNSVDELTTDYLLTVNPFVFEGKTVAIPTTFKRMLSKDEGLFDLGSFTHPSNPILVSDLPSTLFTSQRNVLLAIKVRGTKTLTNAVGELVIPHGDFIGVLDCEKPKCTELLNRN